MAETIQLQNKEFSTILFTDPVALQFDKMVHIEKTAGKTVGQMLNLLKSREVPLDEQLYKFYNGVSTKKEKDRIAGASLRYDMIVVYPGNVAGEYKKTSGHFHKTGANSETAFPEIYEVLHGTALFLLQKVNPSSQVGYAAAVRTNEGEKILIPPGYEHATVNIGSTPLVFSDLICTECENEYGGVQAHNGMCYYVMDNNGTPEFVKNPTYKDTPEMHVLRPIEQPALKLLFDIPVYDILANSPQAFKYLSKPDLFKEKIRYLADLIEGE